MPGSRIGLAIELVHHFVNQCLLNQRTDVKPSAIDKKQWAVMSRSDIWRADRLVFLRPQYWVRPELYKEMSPIFRELISELMQRQGYEGGSGGCDRNHVAKSEHVARGWNSAACIWRISIPIPQGDQPPPRVRPHRFRFAAILFLPAAR